MTELTVAPDRPRSRGLGSSGNLATAPFPPAPPGAPIDIEARLHPTESSRFTLALWGAALPSLVCVLFLPVLPLLALIWALRQLTRAWLLGNSVEVNAQTLPELQSVIDDVRARLDYHERVEVYAIKKARREIVLSSYMGSKILLVEGDFVGELVKTGDRAQLTFLMAQQFGALKARHLRLTVVAVVVQSFRSLRLLNLLLLPYFRATSYSGDQIAQACCGSMEAALRAIERRMVGKELQPTVGHAGLLEQAREQHARMLPRLAQLLHAEPHLANRYLNLLEHNRAVDPAAWGRFRGGVDAATRSRLDLLVGR